MAYILQFHGEIREQLMANLVSNSRTKEEINYNVHLLAVKLMIMNSNGYQLNIPVDLKSDFLGDN